jgi:Ca2+-binding RTX toxin-like protein
MRPQLRLESLERRDTPSAVQLVGSTIQIIGSEYNDTAHVAYNAREWWNPVDDTLDVSLTDSAGNSLGGTFSIMSVSNIAFYGFGGNDFFTNSTGYQTTAYGGSGNDVLGGSEGVDYLFGEGGDDQLHGHGGNDNMYGGSGNDFLSGDNGNDYLSGEAGHDTLYGGWDTDLLTGGADNDFIDGGGDGATDTLYGDGGYDTFVQYHRRVMWWWTNEETLADLNSGMDTVIHVNV